MNTITLVDILSTRYRFIDQKFAEIVYRTLKIESQRRTKSKLMQSFHNRAS